MPKIALNDPLLRSLQPPESGTLDYWDTSFQGGTFGCRVSQGGAKTFILKLDNSRRKIGRFPVLSLAKAREQARLILAERTLGKTRPQSIAYDKAVEVFLEDKARTKRPRTVADYKRLLNRLAFKGQVSEISHDTFMRRLDRFKAEGERSHLLVAAKVFFNWCIKRRYIESNPTAGLSQKQSTPRVRVLTNGELKAIWDACSDEKNAVPNYFRTIVKLLILTGQRRGEIAALHPSWIKNNIITLPEAITKNRREHSFPIGVQAAQILSDARSDTLFFPARGKPDKPFNGWGKSKALLDTLSDVSGWTLHDLRRTFRTNLGKLKVPPHIAERLLNHVSARDPMELVYDQHPYLDEMREAMDKHEAHIFSLVG